MRNSQGSEPKAENRAPARSAYVDALRMLGRRELSEAQVRERLARRQHAESDISVAIDRLKDERAIDDVRVAEAIARTETSVKRHGKLRVKRTIEAAGIASGTAKRIVDSVFADVDGEELLALALNRRLRGGREIADEREFQRLYRYLVRQGFEPDRVVKILSGKRGPKA